MNVGRGASSNTNEIDRLIAALTDVRSATSSKRFPEDRAAASAAGLYSWWADKPALKVLESVVGEDLSPLIYVGQAGATRWPSGKKSAATLASRIGRQHIRGNARSSTFRLTISSLLFEPMGLECVSGRLVGESNAHVSDWIAAHLRVAIVPFADRDILGVVEANVVAAIDPPLNLDHCESSAVRVQVQARRALIRTHKSS